jgi:hypothetical protein
MERAAQCSLKEAISCLGGIFTIKRVTGKI